MFRSASPPPTDKTSTASSAPSRDTSSQPESDVSQPSSFVRAVSSLTLSVGAYASMPQSFRKSLTACDAWPAEPPTPSTNSRALRSRTSARPVATWSTAPRSSDCRISTVSATYVAANSLIRRSLLRCRDSARGERVQAEFVAMAPDLTRPEARANKQRPEVAGVEVPLVVVHLLGRTQPEPERRELERALAAPRGHVQQHD